MTDGESSGRGQTGGRIADEELLDDLRRVADELDGSPSMADVDERGAYSPSTYQSRFGSWTGAKERAGVADDAGGVTYSDDELLDALREFADELGATPTRDQMRATGPHSPSTYAARFGSWTDALDEAGFDGRTDATGVPESDLLADVRRVTEELGRCPTCEEFDERGCYSSSTCFRRFGSWADALDAAGVADEYPSPSRRRVSDDDLAAELRRLADALGHPPTESEMSKLGDHSPETYRGRFGSWADALDEAGLDPRLRPTAGGKSRIPTAKLVADVQRVAGEYGRAPTVEEMREDGDHGVATYFDRFGSWNRALEVAGLDRRRPRRDAIPTRELVRELRSLALALDRRPRRAEMDERGPFAGMTYYNRFGGWTDALDAAGLRVETGVSYLSGYCDACGDRVSAPLADLPGADGLFCDELCRELASQSRVRFESDVLAGDDHLGRLAAALAETGPDVPSRLLFCLGRAVALFDTGFESAEADGYEFSVADGTVTVEWDAGGERRELRVETDTLAALRQRLDAVETRRAESVTDPSGEPATDD